jgi:hypothetical protein
MGLIVRAIAGMAGASEEARQVEPVEYMTMAGDDDDVAHLLERLNELGAQGWEVCASVHARAGSDVIGRVQPRQAELLLLKRQRAA